MPEHKALPLPDYDHLPLDTLRHRIRQLDADGVQQLLEFERSHANRLPVIEVMENWLRELREGAQPSEGSPFELKPEAPPPPAGRPPVSEAKAGPPTRPPMRPETTKPVDPAPPNPRRQ
jgi:hypothetical protein